MSADNASGGFTLNTPEFFHEQQQCAIDIIGCHLLVAARYKKGIAFGHKFNKRQNDHGELIEQINDTSTVVGWGDLGHFEQICSFMRDIRRRIKDLITENYITDFALKANTARLLESASISSQPYCVELLFIDLDEEKLTILFSNGRKMKKSQFCVLGGYAYQDHTQLNIESEVILAKYGFSSYDLPRNPPPDLTADLNDAYQRSTRTPLKDALLTLEEIYGDNAVLNAKEDAISAVKNTLFSHDPPSKQETFEITVFENGKFERFEFKRKKNANAHNLPSRALLTLNPETGLFGVKLARDDKDDDDNKK
jgi:hypothetical protein